jgi:ribosomal protein S18 acetylase RimI-like enzyme
VTALAASVATLRPVGPGDEDFLFRVYASTRIEELAPLPWTAEQKEAFLRQQFHAQSVDWARHYPRADFSIVEVDGVPAGRLYVDRGHEEIRLVDIALLPDFRRNGVGTGLIRDLLAKAQAQGVPVTIHVEVFNPARALYERLGFEKVEDRGIYLFMRWRPAANQGVVS